MLVWFPGLSRAMRFHTCLPASLSPAEAPPWSSRRCRFRPMGTKAGKVLAPFILLRDGRRAVSYFWEWVVDVLSPFPSPWLP